MKKRLLCLLLVLVTALALCVSAAAAAQTGAQLNYVTDAAGLLREGERARLEKMAEAVSQKYRVGVYIVTVEDFRDYGHPSVNPGTPSGRQDAPAVPPSAVLPAFCNNPGTDCLQSHTDNLQPSHSAGTDGACGRTGQKFPGSSLLQSRSP